MKDKNKHGFTLIELLISITILVIISAIGYTTYSQSQVAARDARRKSDLRQIAVALDLYHQTYGRYPELSNFGGASVDFGWQTSKWTTSAWINDYNNSDGSVRNRLSPDFINILPRDPSQTESTNTDQHSNKSVYSYYSWDGSPGSPGWNTKCATGRQYYFLEAHLENDNDPDIVEAGKHDFECYIEGEPTGHKLSEFVNQNSPFAIVGGSTGLVEKRY